MQSHTRTLTLGAQRRDIMIERSSARTVRRALKRFGRGSASGPASTGGLACSASGHAELPERPVEVLAVDRAHDGDGGGIHAVEDPVGSATQPVQRECEAAEALDAGWATIRACLQRNEVLTDLRPILGRQRIQIAG